MERKLKVKLSEFKSPLTFNEWVEKYRVSSAYVEPTPFYKDNSPTGYEMLMTDKKKDPLFSRISRACGDIVSSINFSLPFGF